MTLNKTISRRKEIIPPENKKSIRRSWGKQIKRHWQLYLVMLLPMAYIIVFQYIPMGGITLAFKNFQIRKGILGSPWAGTVYFKQFFNSPQFPMLMKNTLGISLYSLIAGFPIPILLALALNEVTSIKFKKTVQMVTYAPYFISTVVMVAMIMTFLAPRTGIVNIAIRHLGGEDINFMGIPRYFKSIYVWTGIWQGMGYSAVIYIAALSGIDPTLYEAAIVDGASKLQRTINIDIPGLIPTIVTMLILSMGHIMNIGFEKIYLMQNNLNIMDSEIFATYVYKIGILSAQFSFSTAVGLFNSTINLVLIVLVNQIARRLGETSLW